LADVVADSADGVEVLPGRVVGGASSTFAGDGRPIVEVTITKFVVGSDPGIAFPIWLTCSHEAHADAKPDAVPVIPNDGEITETVALKGGEWVTLGVQLPPLEPDLATCLVSENLQGVELPDGYECTGIVAPDSSDPTLTSPRVVTSCS
jgi:hypothetical protein